MNNVKILRHSLKHLISGQRCPALYFYVQVFKVHSIILLYCLVKHQSAQTSVAEGTKFRKNLRNQFIVLIIDRIITWISNIYFFCVFFFFWGGGLLWG